MSLTSPFQANLNSPWAAALTPEWGRQAQKARGTLAILCLEKARPWAVALQPLVVRKWNLYMKIRRGAPGTPVTALTELTANLKALLESHVEKPFNN